MATKRSAESRVTWRWLGKSRPPILRSISDWSQSELICPDGPHKGRPFSFDVQPYSQLLLNELDRWRIHIVTGPTQSGKTLTSFLAPTLYHLFERGENVICGLPSLDMASNKWQQDILPAIEASRYRDWIPRSGQGSKGGTPVEITFANGASLLFMTGGGGDKQRAGATSRVLVITETDGMDVVGGTSREADKISQLQGRVRAFGLNHRIYMECTVSTDTGRTWRDYQAGTASRIIVPCRHCGHWVTPEREHLVGWQDAENKMQAGRQAAFSCPGCGGLWTESDRREMNLAARLIHRGQEVTETGEIVGEAVETDTLGFRWSAFNNLFAPTELLGQEEWAAAHSESPDLADLVQKQQVWCVPAKNDNVEKVALSVGIVRGSANNYAGRVNGLERGLVPEDMDWLTLFTDVSKRILQWEVVAWQPNKSHTVDYGFHETRLPDVVGEEKAVADALRELRDILFGRFPQIECALVDSNYLEETVFDFVRESGLPWRASLGMSKYVHPKEDAKDKVPSPTADRWHLSWRPEHGIYVVNFDPDHGKHRVHDAFLIQPLSGNAGSITLFGDDPLEHTTYGSQVVAEVFVREFVPGKGLKEYFDKRSKNNHMLDCRVGNFYARSVAEAQRLWWEQERADRRHVSPIQTIHTPDGRPFLATER